MLSGNLDILEGPWPLSILVSICSFIFIHFFKWPVSPSETVFVLKLLQNHYWDRSLTARGRNQAPVRSPRNNGRAMSIPESNWSERSSRELAHEQFPVYGSGKSGSSDHTTGFYGRKGYSNGNGLSHPLERVVEIGSSGRLQVDVSLPERNGQQNSALACNSSGSLPLPGIQTPKPVLAMNQDR